MNWYYFFAILCTCAAMLFGYLGASLQSKRDSSEQSQQIEGKLREIGNKIESLQSSSLQAQSNEDIKAIEREYTAIAQDFYKSLPIVVEEQKSQSAAKSADQMRQSRSIEEHVKTIEAEAKRFAQAFNSKNVNQSISLEATDFPPNVFDPQQAGKYKAVLKFSQDTYWAVRFVSYPDRTVAVQFVKLQLPPKTTSKQVRFEDLHLTNDSINLILRENDFVPSLNLGISDAVRDRVANKLPKGPAPMTSFDDTTKALIESIIKHELLEQSLHSNT